MKTSQIIGKQFGGLKVLKTVRVTQPNGKLITKYEVECVKCHRTSLKSKSQLDRFTADGCMECTKKGTRKPTLSIKERNYSNYKSKIQHQCTDREFNLSLEEFTEIVKQKCYYCGSDPVFPERFKNKFKQREVEYFNGIDRVDSSVGYVLGNCVPCCSICNRMKSDFNKDFFLAHINKIYNFNKSSTTSPMDVAPSGGEMEGIQTDKAED